MKAHHESTKYSLNMSVHVCMMYVCVSACLYVCLCMCLSVIEMCFLFLHLIYKLILNPIGMLDEDWLGHP